MNEFLTTAYNHSAFIFLIYILVYFLVQENIRDTREARLPLLRTSSEFFRRITLVIKGCNVILLNGVVSLLWFYFCLLVELPQLLMVVILIIISIKSIMAYSHVIRESIRIRVYVSPTAFLIPITNALVVSVVFVIIVATENILWTKLT